MADYNANIRVSADTKKAESEISKLQSTLSKLSDFTLKLNSRDIGRQATQIGQQLRGIGERGAIGAITLAAGKATTALSVLGSKLGVVGTVAAFEGKAISNALGGIPGVITDILNHLGNVPTAFGVAAVAAMAFAPQLTKAAAGAAGLGAALDKAVGGKTSQKIATLVDGIGQLNVELEATKAAFSSLIEGSTLNELNAQLRDAVTQSGAFHSSTQDAVTAAEQLVAVQREQAREQKAINDLIRQAQGLQPQDVRNTEVSRRISALKTRELQQKRDAQLQNQINSELAEYERLAADVAAQTKQWADNLDRIARSSRAGVLGSSSQIRSRIEEFRQNRNSAEIARQRSAELLALESARRGGSYSLSQVPARGELFPGGNTLAAQPQYRERLNTQALASQALEQSGRSRLQIEASIFRVSNQITAAQKQQISIDERSIQIARERNKLLLEQYRAEQRNPNFSLTGANPGSSLDRASRVADLRRRKAAAKENAAGYENLALGVGFPLLFGGGPGSILGAAGGSFVGSGFGGQILGGAIGQAIDQFAQSAIQLGAALNSPTEAFDLLKERALISTKELEKLGDKLQEAGFAASASAIAQQDINNRLGAQGVRNLQALAAASDDFNRAIAALSAQMQAAMAGPLGGLVRGAANIAERSAQRGSGEAVRSNLSGATQANFDRDISRAIEQVVAKRFGVTGTNSRGPLSSINYLSSLDPKKLQEILDKYGPLQVGVKVKLTPEQVRQELTTTLTKQLEAIDISRGLAQQVRDRARAQEDLDVQRADMVMQQERAIGDLRRSIEDRIVDIRLTNLQRENELLDVQAQIRLQSLKNSNIDLRSGFTNEQVSGAANAIADYLEAELQVANDAAKIKRDAALEVQRLDIETERFKIQTAIQVSRLNQDTAKQVASIQRNVLRQNQDQDTRRFQLEKRIADLRLETLQEELTAQVRAAVGSGRSDILALSQGSLSRVKDARASIAELKAPTPLSFNASGLGGVGVSTGGLESVSAQGRKLAQDLAAAKQALNDLVSSGNYEALKARLTEALDTPLQKAIAEAQSLWDELNGGGQGQSTQAAQRNAGLQDLLTQLKQLKDEVPAGRTDITGLIDGFAKQAPLLTQTNATLQISNEILGDLQDKYRGLTDELQALSMPYGELTNVQQVRNQLLREGINLESSYATEVLRQAAAVDALQEQVRVATQLQTVWQGVGNAMADAMTGGVSAVVNGTQTAQEVFAQFLKAVGDALLNAAQQMIATYIAIGIAKIFAGFGGGGSKGGTPSYSGGNVATNAFQTNTLGLGPSLSNYNFAGAGFTPFASGGFVTRPTSALIGEGGAEYVIPASKMRGAMSRYSAGARGSSVIPGSGETATADNGAMTTAPIDVRYTVERINNVDYVTSDQFQRGMEQAAKQGAALGKQQVYSELTNKRSLRSRLAV